MKRGREWNAGRGYRVGYRVYKNVRPSAEWRGERRESAQKRRTEEDGTGRWGIKDGTGEEGGRGGGVREREGKKKKRWEQ